MIKCGRIIIKIKWEIRLRQKVSRSLTGYLYICNILGNFQNSRGSPLTRQQVGERNSQLLLKKILLFKGSPKEKKFTMDSPQSPQQVQVQTLKRFSYPDVHETVNPSLSQLIPSINPMIYLTAKAHQWHLNMQQLALVILKTRQLYDE